MDVEAVPASWFEPSKQDPGMTHPESFFARPVSSVVKRLNGLGVEANLPEEEIKKSRP